MPTEVTVDVSASELTQIVESVFAAMLSMEVVECGEPWYPGGDRLTAAVHLAGEWDGVVLLECNRGQACRFAARFLSTETPVAVDDVVRDVLGEMANMIGGNLKCILRRGIRLSMPSVVDGTHYSVRVCGSRLCEQLAFRCDDVPFWVTVLSTHS